MRFCFVVAIVFVVSIAANAQASRSHVFPLFADGIADGLIYRSALRIIPGDSANPVVDCTLTQRKTAAAFTGLYGDRYSADVFDAGDSAAAITSIRLDDFLPWEVLRSTASSTLKVGYATLACSQEVHAELHVSLADQSGAKIGETMLAPAVQGTSFEFLLNRRDGTRLGFSLINDSPVEGEYAVIARDEFNQEVDRAYDVIGPSSQISRFIDEVLRLPSGFIGRIEIVGVKGGRSYVIGLQFTGPVFAAVLPIVRRNE